MILDNSEGKEKKVYQWLEKYTEEGVLDIVTGYFTIGALVHISEKLNEKVNQFRMILGSITNVDQKEIRTIDLLNEDVNVDNAFKLVSQSKKAVGFLRQDKVIAKTLEPNFCHAKCYLFSPKSGDIRNSYFISGSSNLTEAGIGLRHTNNIELNIAETGSNLDYKQLKQWFNDLWKSEKAHFKKTIRVNGAKTKIDFKEHLIQEIENIFKKYSPKDIYLKILFELFGRDFSIEDSPEFDRKVSRLKNSVVYNCLYDFQKRGVISLIKMLNKFNGALLGDAVGLGKTWTALAVMKFYQIQGREIVVFCPKRIEHNWLQYKKDQESRFEGDRFDYFIRFHTDLNEGRMMSYNDRQDKLFINDKPKLFVIDESHNFRNHKTNRFKFIVEEILAKNEDVKVLLLSATAINNSLNDLGNQYNLLVQGKEYGFKETLDVPNLRSLFKTVEKEFNVWRKKVHPRINELRQSLPRDFFELADNLIVARTRKIIENQEPNLKFPIKGAPTNIYITPEKIGEFDSCDNLLDALPKQLSAYKLTHYATPNEQEYGGLEDDRWREKYLVRMLHFLIVKRLESSWVSFYHTIKRIKDTHQVAYNKLKAYEEGTECKELDKELDSKIEIFDEDEDFQSDKENIEVKRKIELSEIDKVGNLSIYKNDLQNDLKSLDRLIENLSVFEKTIDRETNTANNYISVDKKLEKLIQLIRKKQQSKQNNYNQKVVIFTHYRDTALYLFDQFQKRGLKRFALFTGTEIKTWDSENKSIKQLKNVLERFAPQTKLYRERHWNFESENYTEWKKSIKEVGDEGVIRSLANPIDILIATDTLSEGQNLQDADLVINYDIHWNPVRIIQRTGRIDRLESPNERIFVTNFWPSESLDAYLTLQKRIEDKMAAMRFAMVEVNKEFSERFSDIVRNDDMERRQNEKMLKQLKNRIEEIESPDAFGIEKFSIDTFKQDLVAELHGEKSKYEFLPNGIYSGFKGVHSICRQKGLIALLGYRSKSWNQNKELLEYELIYVNEDGHAIELDRSEVLYALKQHENAERFVPENIDMKVDSEEIKVLRSALVSFLNTKIKNASKDAIDSLKTGNSKTFRKEINRHKPEIMYNLKNVELITWMIITQ